MEVNSSSKDIPGHIPFISETNNCSEEVSLSPWNKVSIKIRPPYEEEDDDDDDDTYEGNPCGPLLKKFIAVPLTSKKGEPVSNIPSRAMANNQPKLERKDSSGDLHSRLKSRKTLGVGENPSNGEIPRSKTEQMLGYNEHLHMKLPKGYWNWQRFLIVFLSLQGLFILTCPEQASKLGFVGVDFTEKHPSPQYYGTTLLTLAYFLWEVLNVNDKRIMRATLLAMIIYLSVICLVDLIYSFKNGIHHLCSTTGVTSMGVRMGILFICSFYLYQIGTPTSGVRKLLSARTTITKEDKNQNIGSTSNRRD